MTTAFLTIVTASAGETQRVGRIIGGQARPGDVYLLTGPLGAGKTCLTQGLAWGLGVTQHPRSPTFVLMTRYQGRLTLHHMDLYRVSDPLEAWDLGLDEYLGGDGVCVIEWADQAEEVFPDDALWINLDYLTDEVSDYSGEPGQDAEPAQAGHRVITFRSPPPRFDALLQELSETFPTTREIC